MSRLDYAASCARIAYKTVQCGRKVSHQDGLVAQAGKARGQHVEE